MEDLQPSLSLKSFSDSMSSFAKQMRKTQPADYAQDIYYGGRYSTDYNADQFLVEKRNRSNLTILEAKLVKPVNIKTVDIVREQPAINVADVEYHTLGDLDFTEQEEVLGKAKIDNFSAENKRFIERLRKITEVSLPHDGGKLKNFTAKDIKSLFEQQS